MKISSSYSKKFVNDIVRLHNEYRLNHGVGKLVLNKKVSNNNKYFNIRYIVQQY